MADAGVVREPLQLDCRWYRFADAPPGSYACVYAPDGTLETATVSWMPLARGQIPAKAQRGLVLPIPELSAARRALHQDSPNG
jgi:hypothetical protein